jgi:endonuclease YncB( thermonuclease family)
MFQAIAKFVGRNFMGIQFKLGLMCLLSVSVLGMCACTEVEEQQHTLTPEEECFLFNINCPVECAQTCELGNKQCSGMSVQECVVGSDGCNTWQDVEVCPKACANGACAECPTVCTEGQKTCHGKTLKECKMVNGCLNWSTVKTCQSYCVADKGICTDDLPACEFKNGSQAKIDRWKDGDTLVVNAYSPDKTCNERKWNADYQYWQQIRFDVRVHGVDAPECSKAKVTQDNGSYYYECKKDTNYDNENEPYGYEAWLGAKGLVPQNMIVTLSCDDPYSDGTCPLDATDQRYLAYIGYSKNNASYDFSVETARAGNAFSNTNFACDKRADICRAQKEAQNNKAGLWSLGNSVDAVISKMGSTKRKWLGKMTSKCNSAM